MTRRLSIWAGNDEDREPVRLTLAQAVYAPPNTDRTRKQCRNCVFWLTQAEECFIHDADVRVLADMICSYHVFGTPQDGLQRNDMQPVSPELSGLEQVPDGTSCDGCAHYKATGDKSGVCQALWEEAGNEADGAHPVVEALGCCAAWKESS